jgi:hypothetical protein
MPRKLPPNVERNHIKRHARLSFRVGTGPRIRLSDDPTTREFRDAYAERKLMMRSLSTRAKNRRTRRRRSGGVATHGANRPTPPARLHHHNGLRESSRVLPITIARYQLTRMPSLPSWA